MKSVRLETTFSFGLIGVFCLCTGLMAQEGAITTAKDSKVATSYSLAGSLRPPAVSELNGKVAYSGGSMDSETGHNFEGSISIPVGERFGIQGDALYSRIAGEDFAGGAGHWFWRDPEAGLIGLAGGALLRDGVDTYQIGAESAYYCGTFTFSAFVGVGGIRYDNAIPFIDTEPTDFVGRIAVDWYALEDLRLGVSAMTAFANELYRVEAEYQTPIRGLAVTAEAATGSHDYGHCLFGVRWYFGGDKSLLERHRTDDPPSLMPQILQGLGLYGAEYASVGRRYLTANPQLAAWYGLAGYGAIEVSRIRSGQIVGGGQPPPPPTELSDFLGNENPLDPSPF